MEYMLLMFGLIAFVLVYIGKTNKENKKDKKYEPKDDFENDKQIERMVRSGKKNAAIKKYRRDHGGSILNAKRHIDDIDDK